MKRTALQMQRKMARPVDRRRPWMKLVEKALICAGQSSGATFIPDGAVAGALSDLDELRHLRRECQPSDFPVEGVSARFAAEVLCFSVDGFTARAAAASRREAFAGVLKASADLVADLFHEQRQAEMSGDRRYRAGID